MSASAADSLKLDRSKFAARCARDLSTMTADEIRAAWNPTMRAASERVTEIPFEQLVADHNPIYYLAEKVFFANDPTLLYTPLHRDRFCDILLRCELSAPGDRAGYGILAQRDSFKSTFTQKVFPLHAQLRAKHLHNEDLRFALIHHREHQASINFQGLKAKTYQDEWFRNVWGNLVLKGAPSCAASEDYGTKLEADLPWKQKGIFSESSFLATGLGSRMVGLHFDYEMISDPVTDEHIDSKLVRDAAALAYDMAAYMLDTKRGKRFFDGTRYHINDLHGRNISTGQYEVLTVHAIECNDSTWKCPTHLAARTGSCLDSFLKNELNDCHVEGLSFPTRHTYAYLRRKLDEELKKPGGTGILWWLQQMNEVRSTVAISGDSKWFQKCKLEEVSPSAWRVIVIDPAWKGTDNHGSGCDAAIEVWALEKRGSILIRTLLDGIVSNELFPDDGLKEIRRLAHKWNVLDFAPEERGHTGLVSALTNEITSSGRPCNIIKLKTTQQGKTGRMVTFLGDAKVGRVYIADSCNAGTVYKLCEQTDDFPQCVEHVCDALDAAAYTCDPGIAESYVPQFPEGGADPWMAKLPWYMRPQAPADEGYGTQYCG